MRYSPAMNPSSSGKSSPEEAPVKFRSISSSHVSSPAEGASRKVAIAVDPSGESAYAVKWAVEHYLRPGDSVVLLHFLPRVSVDSSAAANGVGASSIAAHIAQPLIDAKVPYNIHIVKDRGMKKMLCLEVDKLGFNVVIIGSRGFGATKRGCKARLGSVRDYCVNHCFCPAVVVSCPDKKDKGYTCQAMVTANETEDTMEVRVDPGPRSGAVLTRQAQH